jgi:hypothetical protein
VKKFVYVVENPIIVREKLGGRKEENKDKEMNGLGQMIIKECVKTKKRNN